MRRFEALVGPNGYYTQIANFDAPGPVGVALLRTAELHLALADEIMNSSLPTRLTSEQAVIYQSELARKALAHVQTAILYLGRSVAPRDN